MTERMDIEQLRALADASEAMSQTDELMAVAQRMADDSQDQWRDAVVRVLDAALALDDAGLRRKVQRLRETLARETEAS